MITIKKYAELHGRSSTTVQIKCLKGHFLTARKIGRNWYIDENEDYVDFQIKKSVLKTGDAQEKEKIPKGYITLKKFAKMRGLGYKFLQQEAICGKISALKIGNQWFVLENFK